MALATIGLVACVQEEVVTVPQTSAITFDNAYLDNATRAAADPSTTTASIADFNVWGFMDTPDGTVFVAEDVQKQGGQWYYANTQYWTPYHTYYFAALSPMDSANWTLDASGANTDGAGVVSFTNVNGSEDLLYAATSVETPRYEDLVNDGMDPVKLRFNHLLSKVKFTFTNGFKTDNAYVEVKNIKMTSPKTGTLALNTPDWWVGDKWDITGASKFELEFGNVEKLSMGTTEECANERLSIPADDQYEYEVTFDVVLYMGTEVALEITKKSTITSLALQMGKAYNFTAEINPENLQLPAIEFEVEVKDWDIVADVPAHVGETVYVHNATEFAAAISDPEVKAVVLNENIELTSTLTKAGEAQTVIAKSFVLDGNGKTLTYTGSDRAIDIRSEVENATEKNVTIKNLTLNLTSSYVERGINYNANGTLVLDGVQFTGTAPSYAVNFPGKADNSVVTINNCELTGLIALNVWGANMTINVSNSVLTSVDNSTAEGYAAVKLNNDGTTVADGSLINIKNSTVVATNQDGEPSCAIYNASETGEIVVAEDCEVVGKNKVQVAAVYYDNTDNFYGAVSLAEAIKLAVDTDAVGIRLTRSFEVNETVAIAKDQTILLDLNGKSITGTDNNTTGNFYLIDNRGNLTIKDNSAAKTGSITLKANTDRDWNASSVVVANNPGGKLVVDGGLIEHLGGSDMAYGIDNLTNGKGTYAETVINGGTIKSPYRAVRQFLNGIEAQNILTVNGGVIEGANKSIWMQDPSKNANTGTLRVEAAAQLKGDVYLFVTAGSTAWPVEVSIADAAFVKGTVLTGNVPAGYMVTNKGGYWTVADDVKTASNKDELQAAIQNAVGNATIVLAEGTYDLPSIAGKDVTIVGTEETVINTGAANLGAGNLTLDGVTITAGMYQGFQHSGVVTYNNVTVNGELFCYGEKDVFNNCTFKLNNQYVWTYGAENIEFNNCVFETNGKAILVYNEGAGATNVVVKNCTFKATAGAKAGAIANQNCAAIEIDNFQSSGVGVAHNVKTSGNTFDANFSGEWRIKNFVAGNAITVNDTEYRQIAVDGKLMTIDANKNVTVLE